MLRGSKHAKRHRLISCILALGCLMLASTEQTAAQDSTVVRVLRESRDFRARTRAALAIGASADPRMTTVLIGALHDPAPAVRVAAVQGLSRLGNPEAVPAVRLALADPSTEVRIEAQRALRVLAPNGPSSATHARSALPMPSIELVPRERGIDWRNVQRVVVVGDMHNQAGWETHRLSDLMAREVSRHLRAIGGVATLFGTPTSDAEREISRRHLPRMRLEGRIARIQRQTAGSDLRVRCEISLMLMDDPGRNLRAALNGAATGSERLASARAPQEVRLAEQALEGAVRSAMSGASQALTARR